MGNIARLPEKQMSNSHIGISNNGKHNEFKEPQVGHKQQ